MSIKGRVKRVCPRCGSKNVEPYNDHEDSATIIIEDEFGRWTKLLELFVCKNCGLKYEVTYNLEATLHHRETTYTETTENGYSVHHVTGCRLEEEN